MKRRGFRVVNWGVWSPAAGLMRKLRFPGKMALISAAFMLPLVWLLASFLVGAFGNMNVTAQERQGVAFNQAVYRLLAHRLQGPFYQRLRVELQLGYAVFSALRQVQGHTGLLLDRRVGDLAAGFLRDGRFPA